MADECPPHGIPRPDLSMIAIADDIPLVLFSSRIYRISSTHYLRITTFASEDRTKIDQIVETGSNAAGPWREVRSYL